MKVICIISIFWGEKGMLARGGMQKEPTRERPCRLVGIGVGSQVEGI